MKDPAPCMYGMLKKQWFLDQFCPLSFYDCLYFTFTWLLVCKSAQKQQTSTFRLRQCWKVFVPKLDSKY